MIRRKLLSSLLSITALFASCAVQQGSVTIISKTPTAEPAQTVPVTKTPMHIWGGPFIFLTRPQYDFVHIAPQGPTLPEKYTFPIYILSEKGIMASIQDPRIDEIGVEWDSGVIQDPYNSADALRVKLLRLGERWGSIPGGRYDYGFTIAVSGDAGKTWDSAMFPSDRPVPQVTRTVTDPPIIMLPDVSMLSKEVSSFQGRVSEVDQAGNYIMVKIDKKDAAVKVNRSQEASIIRVMFPTPRSFSDKMVQLSITVQDIKPGDNVFVKTKADVDIANVSEIGNIDFVHILP